MKLEAIFKITFQEWHSAVLWLPIRLGEGGVVGHLTKLGFFAWMKPFSVQISFKQFTIMFVQNILTEFGKIIGLNAIFEKKTRKLRKKWSIKLFTSMESYSDIHADVTYRC